MNIIYTPNPKQVIFHESQAKYRAFIGGIRSGKTFAGAWETFLALVRHPGLRVLVISPTYPILMESTLLTLDLIIPEHLIIDKNEQKHKWKLSNGSEILYRSADDPDSIRGMEAGWLWADELAKARTDEAWKRGIGRLSQKNMPCRAIVTTTPKGMTWLYDEFIVNATPDHFVVFSSTAENAANLPPDYVSTLEKQYGGAFYQQELMGQFVDIAGSGFFKREWFEIVDDYPRNARKVRYWDLAATPEGDYSVGALLAEIQGVFYVIDIARTRATPGEIERLVRQCAEMDGPSTKIYMEQEPGSSGINTIDHYAREVLKGMDFRADRVTGNKVIRAGPVSAAAQAGNVKLMRAAWVQAFLDELLLFPNGAHDDQVDALSGAFSTLNEKSQRDPERFITYSGRMRK